MSEALVSVVLPVFNGADYLAEALDSVLTQTHARLELLAVDDGSGDDSPRMLAQRAARDARLRIITRDNGGVTAARNDGIAAARGEFLAFIDQDDRWLPRALELHLAALAEDASLGFTLGRQRHFLQPGASPPDWFRLQSVDEPVAGYLPGALCVRRSVFDRLGGFDPRYPVSSDADWFARTADAGVPRRVLDEVTLERRIHGANQSRHGDVIHRELFQLLGASLRRKRGEA